MSFETQRNTNSSLRDELNLSLPCTDVDAITDISDLNSQRNYHELIKDLETLANLLHPSSVNGSITIDATNEIISLSNEIKDIRLGKTKLTETDQEFLLSIFKHTIHDTVLYITNTESSQSAEHWLYEPRHADECRRVAATRVLKAFVEELELIDNSHGISDIETFRRIVDVAKKELSEVKRRGYEQYYDTKKYIVEKLAFEQVKIWNVNPKDEQDVIDMLINIITPEINILKHPENIPKLIIPQSYLDVFTNRVELLTTDAAIVRFLAREQGCSIEELLLNYPLETQPTTLAICSLGNNKTLKCTSNVHYFIESQASGSQSLSIDDLSDVDFSMLNTQIVLQAVEQTSDLHKLHLFLKRINVENLITTTDGSEINEVTVDALVSKQTFNNAEIAIIIQAIKIQLQTLTQSKRRCTEWLKTQEPTASNIVNIIAATQLFDSPICNASTIEMLVDNGLYDHSYDTELLSLESIALLPDEIAENVLSKSMLEYFLLKSMNSEVETWLVRLINIAQSSKNIDALFVKNEQEDTLLHLACSHRSDDVVQTLLESCPRLVFQTNREGQYPIHLSCQFRRKNVVQAIMAISTDELETKDLYAATPIMLACLHCEVGSQSDNNFFDFILPFLNSSLKQTINLEFRTERQYPNYESVETLDAFRKVESVSPLHAACLKENLDIIQRLVNSGKVDINAKDNKGRSILFYAIQSGNVDLIKYLIDTLQLSLFDRSDDNESTIHFACYYKNSHALEFLLQRCAELINSSSESSEIVNSTDASGNTPLMVACGSDSIKNITLLINCSALDVMSAHGNKTAWEAILKKCEASDREQASIGLRQLAVLTEALQPNKLDHIKFFLDIATYLIERNNQYLLWQILIAANADLSELVLEILKVAPPKLSSINYQDLLTQALRNDKTAIGLYLFAHDYIKINLLEGSFYARSPFIRLNNKFDSSRKSECVYFIKLLNKLAIDLTNSTAQLRALLRGLRDEHFNNLEFTELLKLAMKELKPTISIDDYKEVLYIFYSLAANDNKLNISAFVLELISNSFPGNEGFELVQEYCESDPQQIAIICRLILTKDIEQWRDALLALPTDSETSFIVQSFRALTETYDSESQAKKHYELLTQSIKNKQYSHFYNLLLLGLTTINKLGVDGKNFLQLLSMSDEMLKSSESTCSIDSYLENDMTYTDTVKFLLDSEIDYDNTDSHGKSALDYRKNKGDFERWGKLIKDYGL